MPFEEDDKDTSIWFLDHSYLENMFRMFKKVNGEQHAVAWTSADVAQQFSLRSLKRVTGLSSTAWLLQTHSGAAWDAFVVCAA